MNFLQNYIKVSGLVNFKLVDSTGNTKQNIVVPNLIVTSGLNHITARLNATAAATNTQMTHMALGFSSTAVTLADTTLGSQAGRVALITAGGTVSNNSITYTALFEAGTATGNIVEAGIFNASTSGTMLCRTVFPVISKLAGDSLAVTWTITIS